MLGLNDVPNITDDTELPRANIYADSANDQPAGLSLEDYFTSFVLENQENMSETALAQKLGISRKSLWERRNKLGISRKKA
jgi:DNA-binding NtrC family response regulator